MLFYACFKPQNRPSLKKCFLTVYIIFHGLLVFSTILGWGESCWSYKTKQKSSRGTNTAVYSPIVNITNIWILFALSKTCRTLHVDLKSVHKINIGHFLPRFDLFCEERFLSLKLVLGSSISCSSWEILKFSQEIDSFPYALFMNYYKQLSFKQVFTLKHCAIAITTLIFAIFCVSHWSSVGGGGGKGAGGRGFGWRPLTARSDFAHTSQHLASISYCLGQICPQICWQSSPQAVR